MTKIKPLLTFYLAGRIDGISKDDASNWREEAITKLGDNHLVGICPIKHGIELDSPQCTISGYRCAEIFEIDCDLIYRSDAVIVNMETVSFGTSQEIFYANQILKIPVFVFNNKNCNSSFLHNTVNGIYDTLDEVIEFIKEINKKALTELSWRNSLTYETTHYQLPDERLKPR